MLFFEKFRRGNLLIQRGARERRNALFVGKKREHFESGKPEQPDVRRTAHPTKCAVNEVRKSRQIADRIAQSWLAKSVGL
jgi:hypothetical protein